MSKSLEKEPRLRTYATEGRARHYVETITRAGIQSGPVYLIVAPKLRAKKEVWAMLLKNLRELMPDMTFRLWPQVAKAAMQSGQDRIRWLIDNHAGAVLIGARHHHMLRVGPVALAEATAFAANGKPTFAFTGARLAAWPDCQVLKIPEESRRDNFVTAYVLLPLRPPAVPLPTFAASCHMLGIRDPEAIARAAGAGPEPAPRGRERPRAGSGARRGHVPPVRFSSGARTRTEGQ